MNRRSRHKGTATANILLTPENLTAIQGDDYDVSAEYINSERIKVIEITEYSSGDYLTPRSAVEAAVDALYGRLGRYSLANEVVSLHTWSSVAKRKDRL